MDYARLDESGFDDCLRVQHKKLARAVLKWPDARDNDKKNPYAVAVVSPEKLSLHVHETGFRRPCVVRASERTAEALGIRLPPGDLTVRRLAELIGPNQLVNTIDVATQSEGPVYSMEEWVFYFLSPNPRKPLLNVVSLDLSETPLQHMVNAPSLVKELDLVGKVWPLGDSQVPKVQLYALMSVADCFMDFHVDFGGSSVWYHVLSGRKVFLLVPPTKGNLMMFEEWSSSEKQANVFFAERANDCQKVELLAGDTLFLPGGWPHSVATPVDSIVIGGNFLTGYNLTLQLEVWHMEERLKVRPKFRFPLYKPLMWHTASYYLELLKSGVENTLTQWEREGIPSLWRSLQLWLQQSHDSEDEPTEIPGQARLLEELGDQLKKSGVQLSDSIRRSSAKVHELLRGDALNEKETSESLLEKTKSEESDEDFVAQKDEAGATSDEDQDVYKDLERKKTQPKTLSLGKMGTNYIQVPTKGRTITSSPMKRRTPVKKLTKLNSTVRDRILKKIGLDPRIPLPSPKYSTNKAENAVQ